MAALASQAVPSIEFLHPRLLSFFAKYPPRIYGTFYTNERIPTLAEKIALKGNKKTGAPPTKTALSSSTTVTLTSSPVSTSTSASTSIPAPRDSTTSSTDSANFAASTSAALNSNTDSPAHDPETPPNFIYSDSPLDTRTPEPSGSRLTGLDFTPGKSGLPPNPFLPYRNPATGRWRGATISLRRQAELFKLASQHGVEPLLPASIKSSTYKMQKLLERGGQGMKGTGEGQKVKGHIWERQQGPLLQKRIEAMKGMDAMVREWRARGNGRGWKKFPSGKKAKK